MTSQSVMFDSQNFYSNFNYLDRFSTQLSAFKRKFQPYRQIGRNIFHNNYGNSQNGFYRDNKDQNFLKQRLNKKSISLAEDKALREKDEKKRKNHKKHHKHEKKKKFYGLNNDMLDLNEVLKPIASYIKNREKMFNEILRSIDENKLKAMLPDLLKNKSIEFIREKCVEELEIMSRKRIEGILEGKDLISSSDTDDESSDEKNVKMETKSNDSILFVPLKSNNDKEQEEGSVLATNKNAKDEHVSIKKTELNESKVQPHKSEFEEAGFKKFIKKPINIRLKSFIKPNSAESIDKTKNENLMEFNNSEATSYSDNTYQSFYDQYDILSLQLAQLISQSDINFKQIDPYEYNLNDDDLNSLDSEIESQILNSKSSISDELDCVIKSLKIILKTIIEDEKINRNSDMIEILEPLLKYISSERSINIDTCSIIYEKLKQLYPDYF